MSDRPMNQPPKRGGTTARLPVVSGLAALFLAAAPAARAQVQENVLFDFPNPATDGFGPAAPLLADTTGPAGALRALYGTTGFVFKLEPPAGGNGSWTERLLWNKPSPEAGFGLGYGVLISPAQRITPNTSIFGTTTNGGLANPACIEVFDYTCGTVFSVTGPKHRKIYSFTGGADGGEPYFGPVADTAGNLYVATWFAGGPSGCGTVV